MPVWDEVNPGPRKPGHVRYGVENAQGVFQEVFRLDSDGNITINGTVSGSFALAGSDYFGALVTSDALTVTVTGDPNKRFIVNADGKIEWGNGTAGVDTDLYRVAAGKLGTSGILDVGGPINAHDYISNVAPNAAGYAFITYVTPEAQPRFFVYADGKHEWGTGSAAPGDTNLYRSAADTLKTDDTFIAAVAQVLATLTAQRFATDGTVTGATQPARLVGATLTGAPASGTHAVGDVVVTHDGNIWVCTTAGTPGTWTRVPSGTVAQERITEIKIFDDDTVTATGDGRAYFCVPSPYNGLNLIDADAFVTTVSSSGTPTVQIRNVTQAADMLTTRITIDASEFTSYTAATPPVIDAANDDVATGDIIAIDVDVAGTGAKGLGVILRWG